MSYLHSCRSWFFSLHRALLGLHEFGLPTACLLTNRCIFVACSPKMLSIPTLYSLLTKILLGFLRSKKDKVKDKKSRNKADSDDEESNNGSISGSKPDLQEAPPTNSDYIVDSEGFTVRPSQAAKDEDNFYSSSDSDSDSEGEKEKKIYVKINPLKNGAQISASVDQLIASAGALALAPSSQSVGGSFLNCCRIYINAAF